MTRALSMVLVASSALLLPSAWPPGRPARRSAPKEPGQRHRHPGACPGPRSTSRSTASPCRDRSRGRRRARSLRPVRRRHEVTFTGHRPSTWPRRSTSPPGRAPTWCCTCPPRSRGDPVVHSYDAPTGAIGPDKARVVLAHTATVAPADVRVNGETVFTNIANGEFAEAELPSGTHEVALLPTGQTADPILGPVDVALDSRTLSMIYAYGNPRDGSMNVIAHTADPDRRRHGRARPPSTPGRPGWPPTSTVTPFSVAGADEQVGRRCHLRCAGSSRCSSCSSGSSCRLQPDRPSDARDARGRLPDSASPSAHVVGRAASPPRNARTSVRPAPEAPVAVTLPERRRRTRSGRRPRRADGLLDVPADIGMAGLVDGAGRGSGIPFGSTLVAAHVDSTTQGLGPVRRAAERRAGRARRPRTRRTSPRSSRCDSLRLVPAGSARPTSSGSSSPPDRTGSRW